MKNKKNSGMVFLYVIGIIFLLSTIAFFGNTETVDIKYRDDNIDLSQSIFEELNTSKSSWIEGAWYDENNQYMIINLDGTYYHYCNLPENTWNYFKVADSFGREYNKLIKGNYDCRLEKVPEY